MRATLHSFTVLETFSAEIVEGRGMNNLGWCAEDGKPQNYKPCRGSRSHGLGSGRRLQRTVCTWKMTVWDCALEFHALCLQTLCYKSIWIIAFPPPPAVADERNQVFLQASQWCSEIISPIKKNSSFTYDSTGASLKSERWARVLLVNSGEPGFDP